MSALHTDCLCKFLCEEITRKFAQKDSNSDQFQRCYTQLQGLFKPARICKCLGQYSFTVFTRSSPCLMVSHMERGILEVLLVDARGIRHTNLIGKPGYYVIIECGNKEQRSKVSRGERRSGLWNQKIAFEFPISQWKKLTHIKFRIMDKEFFGDGGFIGETIIHLGGIITEGSERGCIEVKPAPYNVVLDDDTYKGEIKIGFRFIAANEKQQRDHQPYLKLDIEEETLKESTRLPFLNLLKFSLLRVLFYCFRKKGRYQLKEN